MHTHTQAVIRDRNPLPEETQALLGRITSDPGIFGGKPIIRGRRLAVEHVLGMMLAGDDIDTIVEGYDWLEIDDVRACIAYALHILNGIY